MCPITHPYGDFISGGGDLAAYEPKSLKDASGKPLYQFYQIGSWTTATAANFSAGTGSFTVWVPKLYGSSTSGSYGYSKLAGGERSLRESWCPSTMVDANGILYTLTFYAFQSLSDGPKFLLSKFVPNANGSVSTKTVFLYGGKFLDDKNANFRTGNWDTSDDEGRVWIRSIFHHFLSPTIAQEINNEASLYIIGLGAPPGQWGVMFDRKNKSYIYDSGQDNDFHLLLWKVRKSDLFSEKTSSWRAVHGTNGNGLIILWPTGQSPRSIQSYSLGTTNGDVFNLSKYEYYYTPQPEWGSLRALVTSSKVDIYNLRSNGHFLYSANQWLYGVSCNKSTLEKISDCSAIHGMRHIECAMCSNFRILGNDAYLATTNPNYNFWGNGNTFMDFKFWVTCRCAPLFSPDTYACYPCTFCLCPNGNNPIICYPHLSYNMNWGNQVSWGQETVSCNIESRPVNGGTATTYASNTLYVTDVTKSNVVSPYLDWKNNTRAADNRRLYLNTQDVVVYTSPTGHNYIIYAYCYPGKAKRLYLGYAGYDIVGNKYVRLRPKYEFRDKDGNTFGNFTDCSRIISMDLKNGHLWITFMNSVSDKYYYFHILAKDLVGE